MCCPCLYTCTYRVYKYKPKDNWDITFLEYIRNDTALYLCIVHCTLCNTLVLRIVEFQENCLKSRSEIIFGMLHRNSELKVLIFKKNKPISYHSYTVSVYFTSQSCKNLTPLKQLSWKTTTIQFSFCTSTANM